MDRNLPPIPTGIFLFCLIASILVYMVNAHRLAEPVLSHMFFDANDNISALYKNKIISLDQARIVETISLEHLGIENHVGQLIPLSSGSYIVNTGGQKTSIFHKLARFFRLREPPASIGASSLLKCDRYFSNCVAWGGSQLNFKTAWSGLELSNGQLIINDTARHIVHLVDGDGMTIDTLSGFRFPNDTIQTDQGVWVVDTNRNSLIEIDISTSSLKRTGSKIDLNSYSIISSKHRFPSIAKRYKDEWIVVINTQSMSLPGLYRVSDDGARRIAASLEDVTSVLVKKSTLYAADYGSKKIWTLNLETDEINQLEVVDLSAARNEVLAEIKKAKLWVGLYILLLMLVGVTALVVSIKGSKPIEREALTFSSNNSLEDATTEHPVWVPKSSWHIKRIEIAYKVLKYCVALIALSFVLIGILMFTKGGSSIEFLKLFGAVCSLLVLIGVVVCMSKPRNDMFLAVELGTDGENILLRNNRTGLVTSLDPKKVVYNKLELFSEGHWFFWRTTHQSLHEKRAIECYIMPLLEANGKYLNVLEVFLQRLKFLEKSAITETVGVIVSIVAYFIFRIYFLDIEI